MFEFGLGCECFSYVGEQVNLEQLLLENDEFLLQLTVGNARFIL